jgi:hypothetical protein
MAEELAFYCLATPKVTIRAVAVEVDDVVRLAVPLSLL